MRNKINNSLQNKKIFCIALLAVVLVVAFFILLKPDTHSQVVQEETTIKNEETIDESEFKERVRSIGCIYDITDTFNTRDENERHSIAYIEGVTSDDLVLCLCSTSSTDINNFDVSDRYTFWEFKTEALAEKTWQYYEEKWEKGPNSVTRTINGMDIVQYGQEFDGIRTLIRNKNTIVIAEIENYTTVNARVYHYIQYYRNLNTLNVPILIEHTIEPTFDENIITDNITFENRQDVDLLNITNYSSIIAESQKKTGTNNTYDFSNAAVFYDEQSKIWEQLGEYNFIGQDCITVRYYEPQTENEPIEVSEVYVFS